MPTCPNPSFGRPSSGRSRRWGGLADEETAAMLIAHELSDDEVEGVADIEPGMEEAAFAAKVLRIGDLRTFERDDEDQEGRVVNLDVADETGHIRVAFWDDRAEAAVEELEAGDVLKIAGQPREGYNGLEVSASDAQPADIDIDVDLDEADSIGGLSLGQSDVSLTGIVLDTDSVRTFDRDDGSEGRVSNLTLGDETGRVRVTLWDDQTELVEELSPGTTVELVDGYVRERNGDLELHLNDRSTLDEVEADVEYVAETTPIAALEIDTTADIGGVVRSADPKRTFDRDDGSEGQVRNLRIQDDSGDIRVALWGEKADRDLGPGDEVQFTDVEIQDGWQDDLEASAGWQASIIALGSESTTRTTEADAAEESGSTGLDAFSGDGDPSSEADEPAATDEQPDDDAEPGEPIEFTGTVVQAGDPVVLDNGTETMRVETSVDVHLGEEVTARGPATDGRLDADDIV